MPVKKAPKKRGVKLLQKQKEEFGVDQQLAINETKVQLLNDKLAMRNYMFLFCLAAMAVFADILARGDDSEFVRRSGIKISNREDKNVTSFLALVTMGFVVKMAHKFYNFDVQNKVDTIVEEERGGIVARAEEVEAAARKAKKRVEIEAKNQKKLQDAAQWRVKIAEQKSNEY